MNLAPQTCPQCGGPLQVTADHQAGFCSNCRHVFTLQLDVRINNLASLIQAGMEYLRQGDFNNAEEQARKIVDLDASRGEGWLLKAAASFDIAQANQSFVTGTRNLGEEERREFALIFKPLALHVWKKANQMLVREAGKPGMSRAAKQHFEIKAKAAQLSAFAVELSPLTGWQEELTKYTPIKSWQEHSQAERNDIFDVLTNFDSKASSDLDTFIVCRDRFIKGLTERLPDEYAAFAEQKEDWDDPTLLPTARVAQPHPVAPHTRPPMGCGGWFAVLFVLILLVGIVGSLVTGDDETSKQEQQRRLTPHEFGWSMGRGLLRSATVDSGSGGMVVFAQSCRAENPTVKTYTNAQYQQFLNGLMDAYIEWRRNGYAVLNTEIRDSTPGTTAPTNTPAIAPAVVAPTNTPSPEPTAAVASQASERSPSGDLVVERRKSKEGEYGDAEIWLAWADGSRSPERLCSHNWRSGQVSFSPDEHWIVVTDGGGPGSSMGTTLRAFYREKQNIYHEMEDAGIENQAAKAALRLHNAPPTAELDHTYAEVAGWSSAGRVLEVNVWGRGSGYGRLEETKVDVVMSALRANYHRAAPEIRSVAPVQTSVPRVVAPEAANPAPERTAKNQADAELNTVYARLMAASGPTQQKRLREEERAWIKWRDKEADLLAKNSITPANDYETGSLRALTRLIQERTEVLKAALKEVSTATSPTVQTPPVQPTGQSPQPPASPLSRVYTVPELKKLSGTRPTGAGLRGDFVLVSREGNQLLLQSRANLSSFGITSTTNGQPDIYRGRTFVKVICTRDVSQFINSQLVTIPAEQALRIISVSKNNQGRIDVEAAY